VPPTWGGNPAAAAKKDLINPYMAATDGDGRGKWASLGCHTRQSSMSASDTAILCVGVRLNPSNSTHKEREK